MTGIVVVCEARADFHSVAALLDRQIASIDWIGTNVDSFREYLGQSGNKFVTWGEVRELASQRNFRPQRGFNLGPDYVAAQRALWVSREIAERAHVTVLSRDSDKQLNRRGGLSGAATLASRDQTVLVALAQPKIEAWWLAAIPENLANAEHRAELRTELGSDPLHSPHDIDASRPGAKRNIKQVWERISPDLGAGPDYLSVSSMEEIQTRGKHTGLPEFVAEVHSKLLPLFGQTPR